MFQLSVHLVVFYEPLKGRPLALFNLEFLMHSTKLMLYPQCVIMEWMIAKNQTNHCYIRYPKTVIKLIKTFPKEFCLPCFSVSGHWNFEFTVMSNYSNYSNFEWQTTQTSFCDHKESGNMWRLNKYLLVIIKLVSQQRVQARARVKNEYCV